MLHNPLSGSQSNQESDIPDNLFLNSIEEIPSLSASTGYSTRLSKTLNSRRLKNPFTQFDKELNQTTMLMNGSNCGHLYFYITKAIQNNKLTPYNDKEETDYLKTQTLLNKDYYFDEEHQEIYSNYKMYTSEIEYTPEYTPEKQLIRFIIYY